MTIKKLFRRIDENLEECFYFECSKSIDDETFTILNKLFKTTQTESHFCECDIIEWGTALYFETPYSSNVVDILNRLGINSITRVEKTNRIIKHFFNEKILDPITQQIYENPIKNFNNLNKIERLHNITVPISTIKTFGETNGLSFDDDDINYYTELYGKIGRNPTSSELYDLSQGNSEHSRHWFFNGTFIIDGVKQEKSPFDWVKQPLKAITIKNNSKVAFRDNASAISGINKTIHLVLENPTEPCDYKKDFAVFHPTLTAETHNFPTGIAPFQGAETGVGGRIRDTQSIGRGGIPIASLAGYCVGDVFSDKKAGQLHSAKNILLKASNGASDYGNKFGEPIIGGFFRHYKSSTKCIEEREWLKPIMFSAGIGKVRDISTEKPLPELGMKICKLGGPAYRIGIGGGSASSRAQDKKNKKLDISAVQRGNAEMENRLNRVIRGFCEIKDNIIFSIHDQGAGGTSNVTKEIVEPYGSIIDLDKIVVGDKTMTPLEIWVSEYQEQNTVLVKQENLNKLTKLCKRENLPMSIIGEILDRENITVKNSEETIFDLPMKEILTNIPKKVYKLNSITYPSPKPFKHENPIDFKEKLLNVLQLPSVASKHFLTSKVDRSVTGLIAQQQCLGPLHTTISDNFIIADSFFNKTGTVSSIGEQPLKGLYNSKNGVAMSVGEMLTNMISSVITDIKDIRCSGNWMWANDDNDNKYRLYDVSREVSKLLQILGFAIDGGKDSLSMLTKNKGKIIRAPNQFVITGYAKMMNINKTATPYFKEDKNYILYIDLGYSKHRLGGSAYLQAMNMYQNLETPNFENPSRFAKIFKIIQLLINNKTIVSCHDRSDGGLITTIIEMSIAGNLGVNINIVNNEDVYKYLFSEELGLVIETNKPNIVSSMLHKIVPVHKLGYVTEKKVINITYNNYLLLSSSINFYRNIWMKFGYNMLEMHTNKKCVTSELHRTWEIPNHTINFKHDDFVYARIHKPLGQFTIGILREEGSNGDKEMAFAFYNAGFVVKDINMRDIVKDGGKILRELHGLVFVGGFSYADALGAASGWASTILLNEKIKYEFNNFYFNSNKFSFGICNGCQLMGLLDWVPGKCIENDSERFESRYVNVKIMKSNSIMLKDMENSTLGVWVAHGEGKITETNKCLETYPVRYVNYKNEITMDYPENPNGSQFGIAGMCSKNGRHLAMMPHPERGVITWQNPWVPKEWENNKYYPWKKLFDNAYNWCCENKFK